MHREEMFKQLRETARSVFQEFAFVLITPVERPPQWTDSKLLSVSLPFKGPLSGTLTVTVASAGCTVIAANVLGAEPGDQESIDSQGDALREVVNILVGRLMAVWFGTEITCDIGLPTIETLTPQAAEAKIQGAAFKLGFLTDEQARVDIIVTTRE